MTSCVLTGYLVAELHGNVEFSLGYHALLMGEGREEICWQNVEAEETSLGEAWADAFKSNARRLWRIQRMEEWLSVLPSTFNGMELGAQEWMYYLILRYVIESPQPTVPL